jgi:hypothetical protein
MRDSLAPPALPEIVRGQRSSRGAVKSGNSYRGPTMEELKIAESDPVFNLLVRMAYEQFRYQESVCQEFARGHHSQS